MTAYERRVQELAVERELNASLRLQTLILSKAIRACGGTMDRRANRLANLILGLDRKRKVKK